jgi:hypothetical protein
MMINLVIMTRMAARSIIIDTHAKIMSMPSAATTTMYVPLADFMRPLLIRETELQAPWCL